MAHSIPSALPLPKGFVKCWNLLSLSTSRQERTKLFNPCQNLSIPIIFARFISSYRKTEIAPFLGKNQTSQKVVWSPNFRDTNEFATETKQSLSNVSLCVFKIARWLKRACNILDRSHVLIRLAVEKDLSPACCTYRRIDVIQLANWTTMTLLINCRSIGCRSWTSLKISWKQRKGTPRMSTWNVLNCATRAVILTSPLNFDGKSSTSFFKCLFFVWNWRS